MARLAFISTRTHFFFSASSCAIRCSRGPGPASKSALGNDLAIINCWLSSPIRILLVSQRVAQVDILLLKDVPSARADGAYGLELVRRCRSSIASRSFLSVLEPVVGVDPWCRPILSRFSVLARFLNSSSSDSSSFLVRAGSLPSSVTMNMFVLLIWRTCRPLRISSWAGSSKAG